MNRSDNTHECKQTANGLLIAMLKVIALPLLICSTSGCCSATLYAVGRNSVGFETKAGGVDKNGNVVVELDRYIGKMGSGTPATYYMEINKAKHRGSRYLVAKRDDITAAIAAVKSRQDAAQHVTNADTNATQSVALSIDFTPGSTNTLWQLYPNDIGTHWRKPRLPESVDIASLEMNPFPVKLCIPFGDDLIDVELKEIRFDKGIHRAWWSKAIQPLYIITVPVDIVTAPLMIPLALLSFGMNVD